MKRFMACILIAAMPLGFIGCTESKDSVKKETTVETPKGKTTTTEEKKVEKSGEAPPPAKP